MDDAVITFRPDNFLTVGLIFGVVYVAAVLAAQLAMRGGLLPTPASTTAAAPSRVTV